MTPVSSLFARASKENQGLWIKEELDSWPWAGVLFLAFVFVLVIGGGA